MWDLLKNVGAWCLVEGLLSCVVGLVASVVYLVAVWVPRRVLGALLALAAALWLLSSLNFPRL